MLDVLDPAIDAGQYVTVLINLGTAQYVMGQFEAALRSLTTALQMCEDRGSLPNRRAACTASAWSIWSSATVSAPRFFWSERWNCAAHSPARIHVAADEPDPGWRLASRTRRCRRRVAPARQALDAALSPSQKARAFYAVGRDREQSGAHGAAAEAYKNGLELDLPQDFPARVALMGASGALQMRSGDNSGRALVERAARLHETHGDSDRAAENYLALAEADRQRQQLTAALGNAQKALSLYESQRLRAVNPDLRATYLATRAKLPNCSARST